MAKDENAGLLSKVVKFVRNPTTNWSDLDQQEADRESNYSKQMLKEMIERKRRNDFVRKREFDMLRKMRRRVQMISTARANGLRPIHSTTHFDPGVFRTSNGCGSAGGAAGAVWASGKAWENEFGTTAKGRSDHGIGHAEMSAVWGPARSREGMPISAGSGFWSGGPSGRVLR